MKAELTFIGTISTPYKALQDCPKNIDPNGPECQIVLNPDYQAGLHGLEKGQNILVLYWLGDSKVRSEPEGQVVNLQHGRGGAMKGTFALRSPVRPNPIGAAVLPIEVIEKGVVTVRGLDCLNGTRLIDIKPAIYQEVAKARG
ncbi:SAM-dependent methyltransferase [Photobacterium sp. BZF1]|uniref:SAM-dependent methyltransferase n=1 Tax=Photobacterium sp. BZF1 TaxID=1904457 RepID=UPI001653D63F|nr:SAM-dependent methyltransferase [Photobacterium sp. BZF1]MBC7006055.1 SAM-dependent methyltransferase [Photobacterium sp. BZF1]